MEKRYFLSKDITKSHYPTLCLDLTMDYKSLLKTKKMKLSMPMSYKLYLIYMNGTIVKQLMKKPKKSHGI